MNFVNFPSTRYQGSKRKILPWIYESVKDLNFQTVLDGCGGTGSVSYLLKRMGKEVTYNDKLNFNYQIGKAIIENKSCKLSENDVDLLLIKNPAIQYPNLVQKRFKDIYFLPKENKWLDTVSKNIYEMNHYSPDVLQYKKAMAFYALFQSSLSKRPFNMFHRKNLEIRMRNVERSFGNKATWEQPFDKTFKKFVTEVNMAVFDSGRQCFALNKSILNIDPYGYDLVYIDPPYIRKEGSNESSNYLKCYHFLEGLTIYKDWENLIDFNSINLRFKNTNHDNDFKPETIHEVFEQIIDKFRNSIIIFSYKKGGVPSIDFIKRKIEDQGKKVITRSIHYKYALNHQNGNAKNNREVLIIGV